MDAINDGDNWVVNSDSGHQYIVSESSCTCPHFTNRLQKHNGKCKHMIFVSALSKDDFNFDILLDYIRENSTRTYLELSSKFGKDIENKLKVLINRGEIFYNPKDDSYYILE